MMSFGSRIASRQHLTNPRAHVQWSVAQDVAGVFAYSADMDTKDYKVGKFWG